MPVVSHPSRQSRSVLKLSLGVSLAMFVVVIAVLLLSGTSAEASVCTLTSTAPTTNWSDTTKWGTCGGGYPGQAAGDTAFIALGGFTMNVDVAVSNSVVLTHTVLNAMALQIPTGSGLTLEPSSTLGSGGDVININGGTLGINGPTPLASIAPINLNSGTLTLNASANLQFLGASFAFNSGTINGSGTITLPAGATPFSGTGGPMTIDQATVDNHGTINFTSAGQSLSINNGGHITLQNAAIFNLAGNDPILSNGGGSSIDILGGGTLAKSGGVSNVISAAVNNGGTVSLPTAGLSLTLAGGGTHTGSFSLAAGGSAISFNGTHTFNAPWSWSAPSGGTFHVLGGTATINTPLTVSDFAQDAGTVNGSGTLTATATANKATAATATMALQFTSNGVLTVTGGIWDLANGGASSGQLNVSPGATLDWSGGGFLLNAGSSLNGAGIYNLTGTAFLDPTTSLNCPVNFLQDGSSVFNGGSSTFTINGGSTYKWNGGQIFSGITALSGGSLLIDTTATGVALNGGAILNINSGTMRWGAGANPLTFKQSSVINVNGGLFDIQTAGSIDSDVNVGGLFHGRPHPLAAAPNAINVIGTGTFSKTVNGGSMIVSPDLINSGGTVSVTAGILALSGADAVTHTGTFNAGPGAILDFSNGLQTIAGGAFTGTGIYKLHGATLDLTPASIAVTNFDFAGGTLQGSGNLNTTTQFLWDAGSMTGTGTTTIQTGAAAISGANGAMSLSRPLLISAGVPAAYSGPNTLTVVYPGGSITNSGTFTLNTAQPIGLSGAPPAGTYLFMNRAGGTLNGNGVINVPVTSDGNVNPGTSPGKIAINNAYTQTATGVLNVDLAGTTPITQYDVLNVNGAVTLAGTLNTITGYTPANGDTYNVMSFTSRSGDFTTKNLTFPGGTYSATYTAGNVLQLAAAVTADLGVTVSGPATANGGSSVTYTVTVNNTGPGVAPSAQVNMTLTSGTVASATGGTCTTTATTATCTAGPAMVGIPLPFTVTVVAPTTSGPMTLSATVIAVGATDPNSTNDNATFTTAVTAIDDVSVTKTGPATVIAGSTLTYNLLVANSSALGTSTATGVVLDDPTPFGVSFVSTDVPCGSFPCTVGTYAPGASRMYTVTFFVPLTAAGTITNTATANGVETDSNPANNSSTVTTAIIQQADLSVTKRGPATAPPGTNVTFTIAVTNNGPSNAPNVTLADPTPTRLTFVSATAPCTSGFASPCLLGIIGPGQTKTVSVTYTVQPSGPSTVTNQATVSTTATDPNSSNNSASASMSIATCPSTPASLQPPDGSTNQQTSGVLIWSDTGAASYNVYLGPVGTGCSTLLGTTKTPALQYSGLQGGITYEWRVESVTPGCTPRSSACIKFTTTGSSCPTTPPTLTSPLNTTITGPTTFTWSSVAGAKDYQLFVNGNLITTTTATSFGPTSVSNGPVTWFVVAEFDPPCASLTSATGGYNACDTSNSKTIPSIVAQSDAGQTYTLLWDAVASATKYEVDEATDVDFTNPTTLSTTTISMSFSHPVTMPTAFFYRVRAFIPCANGFGPNSVSVRIVLSPVTSASNPNVSAPSGSDTLIPIVVHIAGFADGSFPFTASLDPQEPWLVRVDPSTGVLPPEGINLTVFANPTGLPTGTHTGTVIVLVTTPSSGGLVANGTTPVGAPVSISLVTPVTPKPSGVPPPNSLIIPSTGHLDGINSRWASDVRILNTSSQTVHYQITFTPDNVSQGVKQTVIATAAGATTALDDVVKTWYGVGSLGESSNGSLEIRPLDNPAKTGSEDAPSISFTTVASSRTYNAAPNSAAGTLGEFIPAILFQNFVGKAIDSSHAATILSLQQVAQNDAMRTNFGVMEASGQPASVLISVFDSAGNKLLETPMALSGGQHAQLNGFLAQNHISLPDGRIQVQVVGGAGKITAYASVIDNKSGDPILISGVPLGQTSADHFVLPGVADINTGQAAWRTDMRIFNPTSSAQNVQLTFYPVNGQGQPQSTSIGINAGEVKQLDNTLQSTFGLSNIGGAIHVQTATAQPLVISGRTYNLTSNGTYGQLTTAVTAADAIGKGDTPLQILQTEDSVRQRTNVGMFEVTGKPATVEVTVFLPDSKFAPSTQIPLPANGFVQIPVIQSFGLSNVYNARVSMRVVDGDGRIGAYGSVIDQVTQDPTYVPAQH